MLLVIDVGNTHTVFGVYEKEKLKHFWRISTDLKKTEDEFAMLFKSLLAEQGINFTKIEAIVVSCVTPPLNWILEKLSQKYFDISPMTVNADMTLNININIDYPREIGADRIVNAVAAYALFSMPAIIVDFGTATTFCALDREGCYRGGAIAPGLEICAQALFEKTAKLSEVTIKKPIHVIGKNTVEAIQSGIYFGHLGLTRELIKHFKNELGEEAKVIATGGQAEIIEKGCQLIDYIDPLLTLKGLKIIYDLNRNN